MPNVTPLVPRLILQTLLVISQLQNDFTVLFIGEVVLGRYDSTLEDFNAGIIVLIFRYWHALKVSKRPNSFAYIFYHFLLYDTFEYVSSIFYT